MRPIIAHDTEGRARILFLLGDRGLWFSCARKTPRADWHEASTGREFLGALPSRKQFLDEERKWNHPESHRRHHIEPKLKLAKPTFGVAVARALTSHFAMVPMPEQVSCPKSTKPRSRLRCSFVAASTRTIRRFVMARTILCEDERASRGNTRHTSR